MGIFASVIASITASPVFTSAPVQGVITALGLTGATATGQVLALGLIAFISVAALAVGGFMLVKGIKKGLKLWKANKGGSESESESQSEPESELDPEMDKTNKLLEIEKVITSYKTLIEEEIACLKILKNPSNIDYIGECESLLNNLNTIETKIENCDLENDDLSALKAEKTAIDSKMNAFFQKRLELQINRWEATKLEQEASLPFLGDDLNKGMAKQSISLLDANCKKARTELAKLKEEAPSLKKKASVAADKPPASLADKEVPEDFIPPKCSKETIESLKKLAKSRGRRRASRLK